MSRQQRQLARLHAFPTPSLPSYTANVYSACAVQVYKENMDTLQSSSIEKKISFWMLLKINQNAAADLRTRGNHGQSCSRGHLPSPGNVVKYSVLQIFSRRSIIHYFKKMSSASEVLSPDHHRGSGPGPRWRTAPDPLIWPHLVKNPAGGCPWWQSIASNRYGKYIYAEFDSLSYTVGRKNKAYSSATLSNLERCQ